MGALSRRALCSLRLSATPPGLCFGSPKSNRRNGCRGMAGTNADLRSISCCASSPTRMSTCSMCTLSAECAICAFCSHTSPVVAITTLALGMAPEQYCMAMSYLVLAALAMCSSRLTALTKSFACSLSKASDPRSLVMARPAGFSLWTTPILRLVVKANQTKRNVRDLVFPRTKDACNS